MITTLLLFASLYWWRGPSAPVRYTPPIFKLRPEIARPLR